MPGATAPQQRVDLEFDDNRMVPLLYGEHDTHLARLEHQLGVTLVSRGNRLTISGTPKAVDQARTAVEALWQRLTQGLSVGGAEVDAAIRAAASTLDTAARDAALKALSVGDGVVRTKRGQVTPRSPMQAKYLEAMAKAELVFALGPAGTGKTYLAIAQAVAMMQAGAVDRLILSRPAVEAGERLGFLPGDMRDKVDPYMRPVYDALHDMLPAEQVAKRLETGTIEIAPLAFMRGRTLANAFVLLDEAQNTTPMQMKMFLTRLGENSRMVVTGDVTQIDLPAGVTSGLKEALRVLDGVEGIATVRFGEADVVRHRLVARIAAAYDKADRARRESPA